MQPYDVLQELYSIICHFYFGQPVIDHLIRLSVATLILIVLLYLYDRIKNGGIKFRQFKSVGKFITLFLVLFIILAIPYTFFMVIAHLINLTLEGEILWLAVYLGIIYLLYRLYKKGRLKFKTSFKRHQEYKQNNISNPYEVLGCTNQSSDDEIKKAYRNLSKKYHPDMLANKDYDEAFIEYAKEQMQKINLAYDFIKKERRLN